jgi:hypothetical protein
MKKKVLRRVNVFITMLMGILGLSTCEQPEYIVKYGVPIEDTVYAMYGVLMYGVPPVQYAPEQTAPEQTAPEQTAPEQTPADNETAPAR